MDEEIKIPYIKENIIRCLCPTCPVQENSTCAKEKMMNFQELLQSEDDPKPVDYPGMYCANGKAECEDIETEKTAYVMNAWFIKNLAWRMLNPTFSTAAMGKQ